VDAGPRGLGVVARADVELLLRLSGDQRGGQREVRGPESTQSEPDINQAILEFARHYDLTIIPARKRKPKDKAVVESAVQVVERWILARLRNRTFHSLTELNDAIQRTAGGVQHATVPEAVRLEALHVRRARPTRLEALAKRSDHVRPASEGPSARRNPRHDRQTSLQCSASTLRQAARRASDERDGHGVPQG